MHTALAKIEGKSSKKKKKHCSKPFIIKKKKSYNISTSKHL